MFIVECENSGIAILLYLYHMHVTMLVSHACDYMLVLHACDYMLV